LPGEGEEEKTRWRRKMVRGIGGEGGEREEGGRERGKDVVRKSSSKGSNTQTTARAHSHDC